MIENKFQRNVRIAISSNCNMKCIYCEGNTGFGKNGRMAAMEDIRRTPLSAGNITTDELLEILKVFHKVGFNGSAFGSSRNDLLFISIFHGNCSGSICLGFFIFSGKSLTKIYETGKENRRRCLVL